MRIQIMEKNSNHVSEKKYMARRPAVDLCAEFFPLHRFIYYFSIPTRDALCRLPVAILLPARTRGSDCLPILFRSRIALTVPSDRAGNSARLHRFVSRLRQRALARCAWSI